VARLGGEGTATTPHTPGYSIGRVVCASAPPRLRFRFFVLRPQSVGALPYATVACLTARVCCWRVDATRLFDAAAPPVGCRRLPVSAPCRWFVMAVARGGRGNIAQRAGGAPEVIVRYPEPPRLIPSGFAMRKAQERSAYAVGQAGVPPEMEWQWRSRRHKVPNSVRKSRRLAAAIGAASRKRTGCVFRQRFAVVVRLRYAR